MTSKSSVIDDHEHNEGGVEDGEGDEELVEGVAHLLARDDNVYAIYRQFYTTPPDISFVGILLG